MTAQRNIRPVPEPDRGRDDSANRRRSIFGGYSSGAVTDEASGPTPTRGMDVPRSRFPFRRTWIGAVIGVAVITSTIWIARSSAPATAVDRGLIVVDSVRRGPFVREIRASGTLVPEQVRWISAVTAGRVERILVSPGQTVTPQTELIELSNPDVQIQALEADRQAAVARSAVGTLRSSLATQRLTQEATVAAALADWQEKQRVQQGTDDLGRKGFATPQAVTAARERATEADTRLDVERKKLEVLQNSEREQISDQQHQVEQGTALSAFYNTRVGSMRVTAGAAGVVQGLSLQVGQWVNPGATLAQVVQPGRLRARLRVPETEAKDLAVGQEAVVDTRGGTIHGHVVNVDPAVTNGSVAVEVSFDESLPRGARPDLSVDGVIRLDRLDNVLHVGRPPGANAGEVVSAFRLNASGSSAQRVPVRVGKVSSTAMEVTSGLLPGDRIIVSDMSQYYGMPSVAIK